ncbi:ABC-three component system protein [Pseudoalteromonas sp. SSDWG2]|uniref:ABC-three component system protein n=1 Tax=Pseudoalteromonas sp. SSDWG2 TaxID=3139391 RepID=UPI003BAA85A9
MEQDFIFTQQRENCRNLILFIHGFTGDVEHTWRNDNGSTFPTLLSQNETIAANFDIASYSYFTSLTNKLAAAKEKFRKFKNFLRGKTHTKEKNLDIKELSSNLSNHLRFTLSQYDNIYVIAHSMGGLVTKSMIIDELKSSGETKVKLFISLAVPHMGAEAASIGRLFSSNLQVDNLRPVCDFIGWLNQEWINLSNKPRTKYFRGSYDELVSKASAVAIDDQEKDIISVARDHTSIAKPESSSCIVVNAVIPFIEETRTYVKLNDAGYQKLNTEESSFDDQLFVIKLIIGDIHLDTQETAKELYFNAEYVRKLFKSRYDKQKLEELFVNIRQLYKDSYCKFLANDKINSGLLLSEVYEKISDEDSRLLKSLIPTLKNYHKKGMLHQLANEKELDIWWTESKSIDMENK